MTDLWTAGREPGPNRADIVIPVLNQVDYTRQCLESLSSHTSYPFQIIVVDNGSTDATGVLLQDLAQFALPLTVIHNETNFGFTRAANQGLAVATARYVVLLNNDTVVYPDWLEGLIAIAESDDAIGIVGPKTLNPQTGLIHNIGGLVFYKQGTALPLGRESQRDDPQFAHPLDLQYAEGSCMLIKQAVLRDIGQLDEAFSPGYYEDSDYCFRARESGYRIVYAPHSEIAHYATVTATEVERQGTPLRAHARRNERLFRARWGHRFLSGGPRCE